MFDPDPDCIVCVCRSVSEAEIVAAIRAGADSPDGIGDRCLAGTGCGGCVEALRELIEDFGH
ncbi:(2Fe-2S)-binding protein [Kitasatospora sp. NPDC057512]|uniref:(2Fe-2S)-binding protein n=1 Tax=Kitasatospora sp. NPDC057512 TaxID=3346154 RepID=UPI0036AA2C0B